MTIPLPRVRPPARRPSRWARVPTDLRVALAVTAVGSVIVTVAVWGWTRTDGQSSVGFAPPSPETVRLAVPPPSLEPVPAPTARAPRPPAPPSPTRTAPIVTLTKPPRTEPPPVASPTAEAPAPSTPTETSGSVEPTESSAPVTAPETSTSVLAPPETGERTR